jgi:hypothetical protein
MRLTERHRAGVKRVAVAMACWLVVVLSTTDAGASVRSGWTLLRVPEPRGSMWSEFAGVSCVSRRACIAVGSVGYVGRGRGSALVERWTASKWSILRAPRLPRADFLAGVSCASMRSCMAITNGRLVERWDGKA